jgi:hypothetical protein
LEKGYARGIKQYEEQQDLEVGERPQHQTVISSK